MKLAEYRRITKRGRTNAKRTVVDGITFLSKRESVRYVELKLWESIGQIVGLRLQVPYDLHAPGGVKVSRYVADFVYFDHNGNEVIEDSKGHRDSTYKLKAKWMKAEYGITILET